MATSESINPVALMSAGPCAMCGTFTPEDDSPPTIMIGWFASDAACAREAARSNIDSSILIAFRDDRANHPGRSPEVSTQRRTGVG